MGWHGGRLGWASGQSRLSAFARALIGALALVMVSPAAADEDPYQWDPLRLLAGNPSLRLHTGGEDAWEVWVCDTDAGRVTLQPTDLLPVLSRVTDYFRWLSEGLYQPRFTAGGVVRSALEDGCDAEVANAIQSHPNGVLIVGDVSHDGGEGGPGLWCLTACGEIPLTFPANHRYVYVGSGAVLGASPRISAITHELGHSLHFPHSFTGRTSGSRSEYDNPLDMMSGNAGLRVPLATLALNRYQAGWLPPSRVAVAGSSTVLDLVALGSQGIQLLAIPSGTQGVFAMLEARVPQGWDAPLPADGVGVAAYVVDQRPSACGLSLACVGLFRRVQPNLGTPDGTAHVFGPGEETTLYGYRIQVSASANGFRLRVTSPSAPVWPAPTLTVTATGRGQIKASWSPARDDVGVTGYRLLLDGKVAVATGATATSATLSGITSGSHQLAVEAGDDDGNWSEGAALSILVDTVGVGFHQASTGAWRLVDANGAENHFYFGVPDDIPLVCDWNGDSLDTPGLYRSTSGFFYLTNANRQAVAETSFFYGTPADVPLCGDWDGDGSASIGIYRPAEQRVYLRNRNTQGFADAVFPFGDPGDTILAGDWDGDGIDTVAIYRSGTQTLYFRSEEGSVTTALLAGVSGPLLVVRGDVDQVLSLGGGLAVSPSGIRVGSVQTYPIGSGVSVLSGRWT